MFVEFGRGPGFNGVIGESVVAVFAGVEEAAALHFDGDDVERGMVVEAAGLGIEMEAVDIWSEGRHGKIRGYQRGRRREAQRARCSGCCPESCDIVPLRQMEGWRYHCCVGMCYKHRAVKVAAKQELAPVQPERAEVSVKETSPAKVEGSVGVVGEDASRYCPVCSQRLESRRCKLICPVCGYYMSCADYY